jgi:hypothetical protein
MALDRSVHDPDGIRAGRTDQRGSGAEAAAWRDESGGASGATERAEVRTRAEYYAACTEGDRAIPADEDGRPEGGRPEGGRPEGGRPEGGRPEGGHQEGGRPERSGWDAVDAGSRPALDALRVTPERRTHILDGDAYGGGHRHGTGRPGKTEFPASWDDEKIVDTLLDVARQPDRVPGYQERNGNWVTRGTREDVEVVAIVAGDGRVWSGWPLPGGPGVVKNPKER